MFKHCFCAGELSCTAERTDSHADGMVDIHALELS